MLCHIGPCQSTMAMEDVMAMPGWAAVLAVSQQPRDDLPSDPRLHRLMVSVLDIRVWLEDPLACVLARGLLYSAHYGIHVHSRIALQVYTEL